ncbi:MAG: amidase, partial [Actinomycetota bacterium]
RPAPHRRPAVDLPPLLPPVASRPGGVPPRDLSPITAARADIAAGRVSARTLVEEALEAAAAHASLGGVVELLPERARAEADARDLEAAACPEAVRRPLHGVPVTVKDVIDVAGAVTRAGSAAYEEHPARDAEAVARLRAAGAVVLGKVATHEFALGVTTPQARNPHDPSRIPGGSSGGSAIAVATGAGLASLGTDTRASIRVPPALCGLVGFKPTYGVVPTAGVVTLSWTMDHVAPIASTVTDAALMLEALSDRYAGLSTWAGAPVDGVSVGVPEAAFAGAQPGVAAAVRRAVATLGDLGCAVREASRPDGLDLERANACGMVVSRAEAVTYHLGLGLDRDLYWEEVADQLDEAERLTAVDYLTAQRMRAELTEALAAQLAAVDVLAMPTSPVVAPPVEDFAEYLTVLSRNAIPWSLVGFPVVTVPCGVAEDDLPVGLQLVTLPGREPVLVALGCALEAALGDARRPPMPLR